MVSVALNTTRASRVASNVALAAASIPHGFWTALRDEGLTSVGPPVGLRHAVLFRLLDGATEGQRRAMEEALRAMPAKIPQIVSLACGRDAGLAAGNAGFALTVDFATAADYEAYAAHPAHLEVVASFIKPIIQPGSRTAVQFPLAANL